MISDDAKRLKVIQAKNIIENVCHKNKEEVDKYIHDHFYKTQITKAFIAEYIRTLKTDKDDEWINGAFKDAAYQKEYKQITTIAVDANGDAIKRTNKKGEVVFRKVRKNTKEMREKPTFDLIKAREEFIQHFGISVKSAKIEKPYDEFDGLFKSAESKPVNKKEK